LNRRDDIRDLLFDMMEVAFVFLNFSLLILGLVFVSIGADKVVEGASAIAKKLRVSDLVIGLTIVAFGTSAPELVVNIVSSIKKKFRHCSW